jgi:hypothetical protein
MAQALSDDYDDVEHGTIRVFETDEVDVWEANFWDARHALVNEDAYGLYLKDMAVTY